MASYLWRSSILSDKLLRYTLNRLVNNIAIGRSQFHTTIALAGVKPMLINMPALSPTMTEGTIIKWLKKEGDSVNPGDGLCDIQTDKAIMTLETEEQGILAKIMMPDDSKDVRIGSLIALMVEEGEDWKDVDVPAAADIPAAAPPKASAPPTTASAPSVSPVVAPAGKAAPISAIGPAVRLLLQLYQLSANQITATGPRGKLLKGDVLGYIQAKKLHPTEQHAAPISPPTGVPTPQVSSPAAAPTLQTVSGQEYMDIPLTNMRRTIAKRLTESKSSIPHAYASIDCKVDAVSELRKQMKSEGRKVSVNDFIIKAAGVALQRVPEVNVQWTGTEAKQVSNIDVCVAVATDTGLITPIVKDVLGLGIEDISQQVKELAGRARIGKLAPHEFMGGTFTISNLGMFGINYFTAIINPPQAAIMAVGTSRLTFEVNNNNNDDDDDSDSDNSVTEPTLSTRMTVTLSYDGRAIDEDSAAKFLQTFRDFMENPGALLAGVAVSHAEARV